MLFSGVDFGSFFNPILTTQERPKSGYERPRAPQDRPKGGQERPKNLRVHPKSDQERPRAA